MKDRLIDLMDIHEELLVVHSHLTINGDLAEAQMVQEKLDMVWEEIKNIIKEMD